MEFEYQFKSPFNMVRCINNICCFHCCNRESKKKASADEGIWKNNEIYLPKKVRDATKKIKSGEEKSSPPKLNPAPGIMMFPAINLQGSQAERVKAVKDHIKAMEQLAKHLEEVPLESNLETIGVDPTQL